MRKDTTTAERFGKPTGPDVLILVGSESDRHTFVLSESILRQLGPRWESLLSCQSTTSDQCRRWLSNTPKTLNLRDDHPNAIRILLLVATLQFDKVPTALDFVGIVHLTDVAVRYDGHSLLARYMDGWLAPYRERLLTHGYEDWLYVAHEFGYEAEHSTLAKYLAMNCRVDASGKTLLRPGSSCALGGRISNDTLAQIRENRRLILCNILKATYDLWTSISKGNGCRRAQSDDDDRRRCAALNLFAFTVFLRELGVFPMLRTVETIESSTGKFALELSNILKTIHKWNASTARIKNSAPAEFVKHSRCRFGFILAARVSQAAGDTSWPADMPRLSCTKDAGGEYKLDPARDNPWADVDSIAAVEDMCVKLANGDDQ